MESDRTDKAFSSKETPRSLGYRMPAEWETQKAVYLSWPLNSETWKGVRKDMEREYAAFAAAGR